MTRQGTLVPHTLGEMSAAKNKGKKAQKAKRMLSFGQMSRSVRDIVSPRRKKINEKKRGQLLKAPTTSSTTEGYEPNASDSGGSSDNRYDGAKEPRPPSLYVKSDPRINVIDSTSSTVVSFTEEDGKEVFFSYIPTIDEMYGSDKRRYKRQKSHEYTPFERATRMTLMQWDEQNDKCIKTDSTWKKISSFSSGSSISSSSGSTYERWAKKRTTRMRKKVMEKSSGSGGRARSPSTMPIPVMRAVSNNKEKLKNLYERIDAEAEARARNVAKSAKILGAREEEIFNAAKMTQGLDLEGAFFIKPGENMQTVDFEFASERVALQRGQQSDSRPFLTLEDKRKKVLMLSIDAEDLPDLPFGLSYEHSEASYAVE